MNDPKAVEDLVASRDNLAVIIERFHRGHREMYRLVAVELRKLLCDGKNTLVPRVFEETVDMHPLRGRIPPDQMEGLAFQIPALVHCDGEGDSRILELFDANSARIPLQEWLDQPLFNAHITIRELIRSVADKESAHSDKSYNPTLELSRGVKLVDEAIHKQHIVAIGEYVLKTMTSAFKQYPAVFGRSSS